MYYLLGVLRNLATEDDNTTGWSIVQKIGDTWKRMGDLPQYLVSIHFSDQGAVGAFVGKNLSNGPVR